MVACLSFLFEEINGLRMLQKELSVVNFSGDPMVPQVPCSYYICYCIALVVYIVSINHLVSIPDNSPPSVSTNPKPLV